MRKSRIIAALLAIAVAFSLTACTQKPWDADVVAFDPATFTNAQMLEDYDYMWAMLEENYPLLDTCSREYEFDIKAIRNAFRDRIVDAQANDIEKLYGIIEQCLNKFRGAGHLKLLNNDTYQMYRVNYAGSDESDFTSFKMLQLLEDPKSIECYKELEATKSQNDGRNKSNEKSLDIEYVTEIVNANVKISEAEGIPCLKVSQMGGASEFDYLYINKMSEFMETHINDSNIIIDLRGNPGGHDNVWWDGVMRYLYSGIIKNTEYYSYKNGKYNQSIYQDKQEKSSVKLDVQLDKGAYIIESVDEYESKFEYNSTPRFKGNVWILTDDKVASAAEKAVVIAKKHNLATVVGTRTMGRGIGKPPVMFALPNSGLIIQYSAAVGFNDDLTYNDLQGTAPNIELKPREDALDVCFAEIEKVSK